MKLPDSLRAFRHRDYAMFFAGQFVSQIGTWMQSVGQSWLIVTLTDSAVKLGLISTLQFLPTLLFALFGGALADRLPKRKTLIGTQSVLMILAFVLSALVLSHHVQYWHVAVLAACLGLTQTLDMPVRQAYTVEMVGGREDLGNAIALNSALFNGARLVGPAVAGLLIAKYGVGLAFFLNGVSFVAVIIALFFMQAQGLPKPRASKSIMKDVSEGLRYAYATPLVFFLLLLLLFIGLFVINFQVLIPVLAKQVLSGDARTYGFLMSSLGLGALLGAIGLAHFSSKGKSHVNLLVTMGIALCTVVTLIYFIHTFWIACIGLFFMGLTQITYSASTNTTLQVVAPDEMRGRVMSLYQLAFAGTTPFGSLFTGAVMEHWNGSTGWLVDGGIGLILAVGMLLWWRSRLRGGQHGTGGLAAGM